MLKKRGVFLKEKNNFNGLLVFKDMYSNRKIYLKNESRFLHQLLLGPYVNTLNYAALLINQDIKNNNCGLTIVSTNVNFCKSIISQCINANREYCDFGIDNTIGFNPLEYDTSDSIACKLLNLLRKQFDISSDIEDKLYILIINCMNYLQSIHGNGLNFDLLERFLTDREFAFSILNNDKNRNDELINYFKQDYYGDSCLIRNLAEPLKNMIHYLNNNEYLNSVFNKNNTNTLNLNNHFNNSNIIIIYLDEDKLGELLYPFSVLLFSSIYGAILHRDKNANERIPHYIYCDHLEYGLSCAINNILTQGRSFNVGMCVIAESINQLKPCYGIDNKKYLKEYNDLLLTHLGNIFIFNNTDRKTFEYYLESFNSTIKFYNQKSNNDRWLLKRKQKNNNLKESDFINQKEYEVYGRVVNYGNFHIIKGNINIFK